MFARIPERMENIKDEKENTKEKIYFYFSNCYNLFAGDFNGMILKYCLLKKRMKNGLILYVHVEKDSH